MIRVQGLAVRQGDFSLDGIDLEVPDGSYGVLMGRSGCGKTTIMEAVCGLRPLRQGQVWLAGEDVTRLPPGARGIGYVPQDGALFPGLQVRQQLAFALILRKWSEADIAFRVDELAEMLDIGYLLNRMPDGLSGGEKQRVALGRALAMRPQILCLDEPLSALDDDTHDEMLRLIQTLAATTGVTTLHITHSRKEAAALADCIFVMDAGQIREDAGVPQ